MKQSATSTNRQTGRGTRQSKKAGPFQTPATKDMGGPRKPEEVPGAARGAPRAQRRVGQLAETSVQKPSPLVRSAAAQGQAYTRSPEPSRAAGICLCLWNEDHAVTRSASRGDRQHSSSTHGTGHTDGAELMLA